MNNASNKTIRVSSVFRNW